MKKACKILAYTEAILGTIGSFILAKNFGIKMDFDTFTLERDIPISLGIFLGTMISVSIFFVILYSLGKVLENQEKILLQLGNKNSTRTEEIKPIFSNPIVVNSKSQIQSGTSELNDTKTEENWEIYGDWVCPQCKRINDSKSAKCICGTTKSEI